MGGGFYITGTEDASGIAIEEQAEQHFGGVRSTTAAGIAGIEATKVELGDEIGDEAGEVVGRQAVAQTHAGIECRFRNLQF